MAANVKSKLSGSAANKVARPTGVSQPLLDTYLPKQATTDSTSNPNMTDQEHSTHIRPKYTVTVAEPPKFDLPSYISNYKGRTVFRRLYLISSCSTALAEEAARMAVTAALNGKDIHAYEDAIAQLSRVTGKPSKELTDTQWISNQEKKNAAETKRLEGELKQYKNNLIRESIRMGSEELGIHYHETGDLANALKSFNRMKDYTTIQAHVATTAFRQIAVNVEQKNWMGVQSAVMRVGNLQFKNEEAARYSPKIAAAKGLQAMCSGDFKEAASSFLNTDFALADTYSEVISSNDIAVYGGLCALASMSRSELQSNVLDSTSFRSFLELEPHIRRAINYFCASKYSQCLEILESYRVDYLLDIYLQDVLGSLYARIRSKAIVQYFQPFSRVTLSSMEALFDNKSVAATSDGNNQPSFQDELTAMIQSKALKARLDLENNVLIAYEESPRLSMQKEALEKVDTFICNAQVKLLRLNAVNGGLMVKAEQRDKGKGNALDLAQSKDAGNYQGNAFPLKAST